MTIAQPDAAAEIAGGELERRMTVVPHTGEAIVPAEMTNARLARAFDDARAFEQLRLRAFKRALQHELLRRMYAAAARGQSGAWTIRDGEWKLTAESPAAPNPTSSNSATCPSPSPTRD